MPLLLLQLWWLLLLLLLLPLPLRSLQLASLWPLQLLLLLLVLQPTLRARRGGATRYVVGSGGCLGR
jgi:hypothetical protein